MVQSVELVLDEGLDRLVRAEWALLVDAGLPSQARHTGPSNAPHVTVGVAAAVTEQAERDLQAVDVGAGREIVLGGLLVFGGRRFVLARMVVPTAGLLRTHHDVQGAWADLPGRPATLDVGRWSPHVTLARRMDADQLAVALDVLADRPDELVGSIAAGRRWDSDDRRTWLLPG